MTRQEIQEAGASVLLEVLRESQHKNYYFCPACGKPKVYKPSNESNIKAYGLWSCLSCGERGDVYNALQYQGLTAREAFAWVMERTGRGTGNRGGFSDRRVTAAEDKRPRGKRTPEAAEPDLEAWRAGCADYCREAAAALPSSPGERYLMGRGLDAVTLRRALVGYDRRATVGGALKYGREAVILPYDSRCGYYSARLLEPFTDRAGNLWRFVRPSADKAGGQPVFHGLQLWAEAEAVFIVESEIDCLSINQAARLLDKRVGCVATGGGNNTGALLRDLTDKPTRARLLIAFDDDRESGAGWIDALRLSKQLTGIGQAHELVIPWRSWMGRKDCNDILREPDGTAQLAGIVGEIIADDYFTVPGSEVAARLDELSNELALVMS